MDRTKPSCCRRLFDADGTTEELPRMEAIIAEERQRARERWNFDFENDVPLEGRYEWVRVAPPSPPAPNARAKGKEGPRAGEKTQGESMQTSDGRVAGDGAEEALMDEMTGRQDSDAARSEEGEELPTNSEQAHD